MKIIFLLLIGYLITYLILNIFWKEPKTGTLESKGEEEHKSELKKDYAIALSGGGYRAMLYHLGVLWRLHDLGLLKKIDCFSSVSGGSITSAWLGLHWNELEKSGKFKELIADPILETADNTVISPFKGFLAMLLPKNISFHVERGYSKYLFKDKKLNELTSRRKFVILSTNLRSGKLVKFSRNKLYHYPTGTIKNPDISIAKAVTASSAFPPFLAPSRLVFEKYVKVIPDSNCWNVKDDNFNFNYDLADGGVYDNLGLEEIDDDTDGYKYKHIFISDAGAKYGVKEKIYNFWGVLIKDVLDSIDSQVRSLRIQQVNKMLKLNLSPQGKSTRGVYWQIHKPQSTYSNIEGNVGYEFKDDLVKFLAETPTVLSSLSKQHQELLVNWGYIASDNAIRNFFEGGDEFTAPTSLPFEDAMDNWEDCAKGNCKKCFLF